MLMGVVGVCGLKMDNDTLDNISDKVAFYM